MNMLTDKVGQCLLLHIVPSLSLQCETGAEDLYAEELYDEEIEVESQYPD